MPRNLFSKLPLLPTRVLRLDTTQSTNADALGLARDGENGPLWIVAREQSHGRGRRGRAWQSPAGNLYASLLLIEPCAPDVAPQLGFVAGVALIDAIGDLIGAAHPVKLKWPNDLLSDGAKLAGILIEGSRRADGAFLCVIGIGVNCRSHPAELPYAATHLAEIAGHDAAPDTLLPLLDRAVLRRLAEWDAGRNFNAIREAWLFHAAGQGGSVEAILHDRTIRGRFETIDAQGRMIVATDRGPHVVDAGDVCFTSGTPLRAATAVA